jgi:hypothetical protein
VIHIDVWRYYTRSTHAAQCEMQTVAAKKSESAALRDEERRML